VGGRAGGDVRTSGGAQDPSAQLADIARIAESVRGVVDARAAAISRVVDKDLLEVLAVAGAPSRDVGTGKLWSRSDLDELLAKSGRLAHPHATEQETVSYVDGPRGLLLAPLRTADGELLGVLATEGPVENAYPAPGKGELVALYAGQARLSLGHLIEHDRLADEVRLLRAGEQVLHDASGQDEPIGLLETVTAGLAGMVTADAAWACLDAATGAQPDSASYPVAVAELVGPDSWDLLRPLAEECWGDGTTLTDESSPLLGRLAALAGQHSALMAAVGTGTLVHGAVVVLRGAGRPTWSDDEREAVRSLGSRLGSVVRQLQARRRDRHLVDELRALDQRRRDLVVSITHDLKTPLTAIAINAELLGSDERPADGEDPVAAIRRSTERLASLVDDLLALARADEGALAGPEDVDLVSLVREACQYSEPVAQGRGISFHIDAPEELRLPVDADALARVFGNVVSNAVKFSQPGGQVRLQVRRTEDGVEFVCADDGIGIAEEDLASVFDMFRRASDPQARGIPGSGFGLAISQRIVSRLGGTIEVESKQGHGSTFTVRLPLSAR
jgi:signal transduction histidine kinase